TVSVDFSDGIGKYSWGFFGSFRCAVDDFFAVCAALFCRDGTFLQSASDQQKSRSMAWDSGCGRHVSGCICPVAGENGGRFLSLVCAGVFYAVVRPFWTLFW